MFYISVAFLCLLPELFFLSRLSQFSQQTRQPSVSSSSSSSSSSVQIIPQIPPFQGTPTIKPPQQKPPAQQQHLVQNNTVTVDWQALAQELSSCKLPPKPPRRETWERNEKPIFVSSYPLASACEAIGDFDLIRPLVTAITGLNRGARNYHSTTKSLKRCHTHKTETVTCSNVYPIFNIQPDKLASQFDPNVVIAIRNFATAFPMGMSLKGNRYSKDKGQESIQSWRSNRDEFIESAFANWKSIIVEWKNMSSSSDNNKKRYYHIHMYLPYEYMMDPIQGPTTVLRLAKLLNASNFPSAMYYSSPSNNNNNDEAQLSDEQKKRIQQETDVAARCVWFQSVTNAHDFEQNYMKYTPGYRTEQRDYMLQQMQQLQNEFHDDAELVRLLQLYYQQIRDETIIDDDDPPVVKDSIVS